LDELIKKEREQEKRDGRSRAFLVEAEMRERVSYLGQPAPFDCAHYKFAKKKERGIL